MNEKITWIDALKGIAICGVIMIHCGGEMLPSVLGKIGRIGANGVQIFFLISAYLSYVSLDKYFGGITGSMTFSKIRKWWIGKFLRLIPLYYLVIIIMYFFMKCGGDYKTAGNNIVLNFISHFLFLHGFFPGFINSIVAGGWYIGDLAIFYMIVPLVYRYIRSMEKAFLAFVFTSFMCYGVNHLAELIVRGDDTVYSGFLGNTWIFMQLPVMMFGVFLYFILKRFSWKSLEQRKLMSYTILFVCIILIMGEAFEKNYLLSFCGYTRFAFWFSGIMVSQTIHSSKLIDNKLFQELGKNSYAIYLIHPIFISLLKKMEMPFVGNNVLAFGIKYLTVIMATFLFAFLLTKYVDKPIVARLKKTLER